MRSFREILSSFSFLIVFKKPQFLLLEFLDIIIEDKPLLLISWQLKNGYKLSLKQLKKTFRKKEGSVILQLPAGIPGIDIHASNLWRNNEKKIRFTDTKLDKDTAALLIQQFKPLSNVEVKKTQITVKNTIVSLKANNISLKSTKTYIKKRFRLKAGKFDYPKTNFYEPS